MKHRYRSKVTRKGQITIPAQARRDVGLKIGDTVDVIVESGRIVGVELTRNLAERTYGVFKNNEPRPITKPWEAWADAVLERDERTKRGEQSNA